MLVSNKGCIPWKGMKQRLNFKYYLTLGCLSLCGSSHASFIEQTLGSAVVRDATAVYFNPAALTVIGNKQLIIQDTIATLKSQFTGIAEELPINRESGASTTKSNFSLPSLYLTIPINEQFAAGFAVVANDFNRSLDDHSLLRYVQARNQTDDLDLVPALGIKINEFFSLGGNLNFSHAHFIQEPISGIPRLNIPENRSFNNSKGNSLGGDLGVLMTPDKKTTIGFNYRSAITYHLQGTSRLNAPEIRYSTNYHFKYWTPARNVLSVSHFPHETYGFISTLQYLQWNIFKSAYVYNFVSQAGSQTFITPRARINYNFHNSWLATLGTIYNFSSKWTVRVAGTYNQSPSNGRLQISTGDSLIIGSSISYKLLKNTTVDCSYGHAFFKKQRINISTAQNSITGINQGRHDSVSLKLTLTA